jgi:enoyl-CoA hydratase
MSDTVLVERDGPITIVSINRPHCRNAVDGATARKLYDAFLAFDADEAASVAVFTGTGGYFCAGADLKAVASGDPIKKREIGGHDSIAPMGPSRLRLSKPVIAAVEGFAVAGWSWRCGLTCAWSPRTPPSASSAAASACR